MDAMDVKAQGAGGQRITGTNIVVVGEAVAAQRCGVRGGDEAEEEEEEEERGQDREGSRSCGSGGRSGRCHLLLL